MTRNVNWRAVHGLVVVATAQTGWGQKKASKLESKDEHEIWESGRCPRILNEEYLRSLNRGSAESSGQKKSLGLTLQKIKASILQGVFSTERGDLRYPRQEEQQDDLNAPPDHMPLGGESGSVEREVVDPHVEVGQRHGDHQQEEKHGGVFSGVRYDKADSEQHLEAAAQQIPKGWSAEVRRDYRFEWFGIGPVQETNSAKGQPEHHGESVGKTGCEPAGEHGFILVDFDWDCGQPRRSERKSPFARPKQRRLSLWMRRFSQQCHT